MATNSHIVNLHSDTKGKKPSAEQIKFGEIAVNYNDEAPFIAFNTSGATGGFVTTVVSAKFDDSQDAKLQVVDGVLTIPIAEGAVGPQGWTGGVGPRGWTGPVGPTGAIGPIGYTGGIGPQGYTGKVAGPTGAESTVLGWTGGVGPQGYTGKQAGPTGAESTVLGWTGGVGPQGYTGKQAGPTGQQSTVVGWTGGVGPQGYTGTVVGPTGQQSKVVGWTGGVGPQGYTGTVAGPTGVDSIVVGATGKVGPQGYTGKQAGPTGVDSIVVGWTGGVGPQGYTGTIAGPTGVASTVAGATGKVGPQGYTGTIAGPTGAASTVVGWTGGSGKQGWTGPCGADGKTVSFSVNGGTGYLVGHSTTTAVSIATNSWYKYTGITIDTGNSITTSGKVTATNGFYQSSDERYKDFGNDVNVDFDKLASIPKKYFTWKNDEEKKRNIGTSAQAVQVIYPELVKENSEDGYLTVAYDKLAIIALKAVDELYKQNQELKARIEELENKIK